ncbi:MAG TPA: helix-turn-helix domain-containing protein [Kofleriaceae bacterium]|nr:helix-turn-helix domain-containing protein [Kofleriaceae bacterium]
MATTKLAGSARERLLAAANELFYEEGVHTVGIDRVIERAGVAKASLYSTFGSKEELVRAYLQARAEERQRRISAVIAKHDAARARILALYDYLGERTADPAYRGCAFINATAEGPRAENKVSQVCNDSRAWLRGLFIELARDAGAHDPELLGRQLVMLYDGAAVAASMERDLDAARRARAMANALLDAQTSDDAGKPPAKTKPAKRSVRATK